MRFLVIAALLPLLGGCVQILRHEALSPSRAGAEAAMAAAEQSRYITGVEASRVATETSLRERFMGLSGPAEPLRPASRAWPLTGCLASGDRFFLAEAEIGDDGVCGGADEGRQCYAWSEMTAIGRPYDATVIGYFPVAQFLQCAAP